MRLFVLIFTLALVMFNLTLPIMAGLYIVSDLGGSAYLSPYGVCFFCIGNAIGVPFGKPSVTRLSAVQMFIVCLGLMCMFSWGCAISTSYLAFIIFRFLEGLASGPLFLIIINTLIPLVLASEPQKISPVKKPPTTFFKRYLRQEFRGSAFVLSLILACFSSVPVVAACWGDWIAFHYHWRFLFFANIPFCLFLMAYVRLELWSFHQPYAQTYFDRIGFLLYFIAVLFLGTALVVGQEFDWFRSNWMTFLIVVGALSTFFFILRSLYHPEPIIDFRLFKNVYFCFSILNLCVLFSMYFGVVVLLSLWLKLYINYTPDWIVLLTAILAIGAGIPLLINYKAIDPRIPLGIALLFYAVSCFYATCFNVEINFGRIAFSRVLAGLAIPFFLPSLFRLAIHSFPAEKTIESANVFHILRLLFSGLGAGLYIILWQRRQVFYNERLGSRLTEFSQITVDFLERARQFHLSDKQALAQLGVYLDRYGTALALDDCFYLMGWLVVFLLAILGVTYLFRFHHEHEERESES